MAYEKKDNSAIVFFNDKKLQDTHPDFKGDALIGGVFYWVSMWRKTGKNGGEFFSMSFKPKDQVSNDAVNKEPEKPNSFKYQDDDAVPF